jgi:hypothetical protein
VKYIGSNISGDNVVIFAENTANFEGATLDSKGDTYVINEELQHTDHLFLGVACFTFK